MELELCERCSSVCLSALQRDLPAGLASRLGAKEGMVLLQDGSSLAKSASQCRLCGLVQEALLRSFQASANKDKGGAVAAAALSLAREAVVLEPKSDSQGSTFPDPPTGGSHLTGLNVTATELVTGQLLRAKIRLYTHGQRMWALQSTLLKKANGDFSLQLAIRQRPSPPSRHRGQASVARTSEPRGVLPS